jgi:hypothetical protein
VLASPQKKYIPKARYQTTKKQYELPGMLEVIEEAGDEPGCAGFGSDEKLEPVDDREGDLGLGESDKEEVEGSEDEKRREERIRFATRGDD